MILKDEVILPLNNKVQSKMDGWENLCISFTAKGFEKYITIGNFTSASRTVTDKMSMPRGFKGEQQQIGYYFIDALSLKEVARDSDCTCEEDDEPEGPKVIFSKSSALTNECSSQGPNRVKYRLFLFQ